MCNRYAADIRKYGLSHEIYGYEGWSETRIDPKLHVANSPLEIFPKSVGPVVRQRADGAREVVPMRWGLPGPSSMGGAPVTNIRNVGSSHWRPLLGQEHRCLVPFTAFSEYEDNSPKGAKVIRWFAPANDGVAMFAGICRTWRGDYGSKKEPNIGEHVLFSFLTTEPNDLVRPVHAKAMPVVLTTEAEQEEWLHAAPAQISKIQSRALPNEALKIVADDEAAQFAGAYLK